MKDTGEGMANFGKGLKSITRILTIVALIAGIVKLIKGAFDSIVSNNEELAAKIDKIKTAAGNLLSAIYNAVAKLILPVVEFFINLLYTAMSYLNSILSAWFGIDLFAKDTDKSLQKSNKSAKALKKTLASFDEINTIGDNSSGGAGGGSSAGTMEIPDVPVPEWLQWIIDHKDESIQALYGIAAGLTAIGLGASLLQGLGVAVIIYELADAIRTLTEIWTNIDPTIENNGTTLMQWGDILKSIGIIIGVVGLLIASIPTLIVGAIVAVVGLLMKFWETIRGWLDTAIGWLDDLANKVEEKGFGITAALIGLVSGVVQIIRDLFDGVFRGIKQVLDGIILIFKGQFLEGIKSIGKGIANILIGFVNALISAINAIWTGLLRIVDAAGSLFGADWKLSSKLAIPKIPLLASGGIVDVPRRGVNIGGAIAGEAGPEGVLPFNNEETMARVGQEIGKWITLNIDITNEIDGRVLNKRLETIKNNSSFARNGV